MPLSSRQKRFLRGEAHARHPLVRVGGNGLTAAVLSALDEALEHHELVKVRIEEADREGRARLAEDACRRAGAELVQLLGGVATCYRRHPSEPRLVLPA